MFTEKCLICVTIKDFISYLNTRQKYVLLSFKFKACTSTISNIMQHKLLYFFKEQTCIL